MTLCSLLSKCQKKRKVNDNHGVQMMGWVEKPNSYFTYAYLFQSHRMLLWSNTDIMQLIMPIFDIFIVERYPIKY